MSQKYKRLTGVELIKGFCAEVLAYGIKWGLDVNGVKIWIPPRLIKALELGECLSVEVEDCTFEIPIIEKDSSEIALGDGTFQEDIFVGNPEWEIVVNKGEVYYAPRNDS